MSLVLVYKYLGTDERARSRFTVLAFGSAQWNLDASWKTRLLALLCFLFCFSMVQGIELWALLIITPGN